MHAGMHTSSKDALPNEVEEAFRNRISRFRLMCFRSEPAFAVWPLEAVIHSLYKES